MWKMLQTGIQTRLPFFLSPSTDEPIHSFHQIPFYFSQSHKMLLKNILKVAKSFSRMHGEYLMLLLCSLEPTANGISGQRFPFPSPHSQCINLWRGRKSKVVLHRTNSHIQHALMHEPAASRSPISHQLTYLFLSEIYTNFLFHFHILTFRFFLLDL